MTFFRMLSNYGALNNLSIDTYEHCSDLYTDLGYTDFIEDLDALITNKHEGEDLSSDVNDIMLLQADVILKDFGLVLKEASLSLTADILDALKTLIHLEPAFKEETRVNIDALDNNIEILNYAILPHMLKNTSEFEFLVDYVSDDFIFYINLILKTNDLDLEPDEVIEIHHIINWLKSKFDFDVDDKTLLESNILAYSNLSLKKILKLKGHNLDVDGRGVRLANLIEYVSLVLISEDGIQSPIEVATSEYGYLREEEPTLFNGIIKLLGDYHGTK